MVDQDKLLAEIKELLVALFGVDAAALGPQTDLYTDLELDSIDAVDLIVQLQKQLHRRIDPEAFQSVRKVGDVVQVVSAILEEQGGGSLAERADAQPERAQRT